MYFPLLIQLHLQHTFCKQHILCQIISGNLMCSKMNHLWRKNHQKPMIFGRSCTENTAYGSICQLLEELHQNIFFGIWCNKFSFSLWRWEVVCLESLWPHDNILTIHSSTNWFHVNLQFSYLRGFSRHHVEDIFHVPIKKQHI